MIVYTAIFNNHDRLFKPAVIHKDVTYACICDGMIVSCKEWDLRRVVCRMPPDHCAAYYQAHAALYFPGEITVWRHSSVRLDIDPLILKDMLGDSDIAVLSHPERDCIYQEAETSIRWHMDQPLVIRNQIARYRLAGYPEHNGLSLPYLTRHAAGAQIRGPMVD